VDTDPQALASTRDALPAPQPPVFKDALSAAKATRPDAIAMVVPNPARQPLLEHFLRAGFPAFVEKPLVHSPDQLSRLGEILAEYPTPLMVAQNYRYSAHSRALRRFIEDAQFGRLREIHIAFARNGRNFAGHPVSRMAGPTGLLMELGIHHLDLLRYLVGQEPSVLHAEAASPLKEFAGWTRIDADLAFPSGTTAHYSARYNAAHDETPWGGSWNFIFDHGEAHYFPCPSADAPAIRFSPVPPFGWPKDLPTPDAREQRQNLLQAALAEFATSLDENRPAETGFADNCLTIKTAFAIARAAGWDFA
jgi:predicted dehydrogenase